MVKYIYLCGPNKKYPEVTNTDSIIFFSTNEKTESFSNELTSIGWLKKINEFEDQYKT